MNRKVDILIKDAQIIDGTGRRPYRGSVAIDKGCIARVGDTSQLTGNHQINAKNKIVTPGFIDCHTHDDRVLLDDPDMTNKITQGVTTVIAGNCGISLSPFLPGDWKMPIPMPLLGKKNQYCFPSFPDYIRAFNASPPALNAAFLCGHNTLRAEAMKGDINRCAEQNEIGQMLEKTRESILNGAIGLSSGLMYPAGFAAPTSEVTALAAEAGRLGGLYATHLRNEAEGLIRSVEEAAEIGRKGNLPVVLSHHKVTGRPNWGDTKHSLRKIEQLATRQTIHLDVYPYTASATALMPERLSIAEEILIVSSEKHPEKTGKYLREIAKEWGISKIRAAKKLLPAQAIYFAMDEGDVRRVLTHDLAMIGSDGIPGTKFPHPRLWGTFPRVLGYYSREVGLFPLETAVHKMTGLTAKVFGFRGRGILRRGAIADIAVFDPATVIDRADFSTPTQPSIGIDHVIVNGEIVLENGIRTNARPGRIIKRET